MAFFPGEPGLAVFIESMGDRSGGDTWSYKTCKAPVKSSPPTNQHPTFYRPDVLPVAQPTASEHWRENTIVMSSGDRSITVCVCVCVCVMVMVVSKVRLLLSLIVEVCSQRRGSACCNSTPDVIIPAARWRHSVIDWQPCWLEWAKPGVGGAWSGRGLSAEGRSWRWSEWSLVGNGWSLYKWIVKWSMPVVLVHMIGQERGISAPSHTDSELKCE